VNDSPRNTAADRKSWGERADTTAFDWSSNIWADAVFVKGG
jgi:hypothetical protein